MKQPFHLQYAFRWTALYIVLLLAVIPIAQPVWNNYFEDSIGKVISVEWMHIIAYGLLGILSSWGYLVHFSAKRFIRLFCLLVLIGLLDESLQTLFPNRYFQWFDVFLNGIGGIMGVVIFLGCIKVNAVFRSSH